MDNPLPKLMQGQDLSREEAAAFADALFQGNVPEGLLGGVLVALANKGETTEELAGFAQSMRAHVTDFGFMAPQAMDTCGTGGSGKSVMNTGTLAGLIVAAAGGKVAKHGNRAISGKCGSADLLEALGIPLTLEPAALKQQYDEEGFVFLFAPACHPAMKHVGPTRKALGVRTVFNFLGPLTNPLGARRHMLGVGDSARLDTMAAALKLLGVDRALVLHGQSGLDEVEVSATTHARLIEGDRMEHVELFPHMLGLDQHPLEDLTVKDVAHSLSLARDVLDGKPGAPTDFVLANAGTALWVAGLAADAPKGVKLARETLQSGKAKTLVARLSGNA